MKNLSVILILSILAISSCGSEHREKKQINKAIFRYNIESGLNTLDPARIRQFDEFVAAKQIYNNLVTLDEDMNVVPDIAKTWTLSKDGRTYTFYLKENVKFHENECFTSEIQRKVTAEDVVYSYNRVIDPKTASSGSYIFKNIMKKNGFTGIEALDEHTIRITLKEPQPSFLYQLSLPYCFIVPSEAVAMYGNDFSFNPVGTGPFRLLNWARDSKIVLTKNESYFEIDIEGNKLPYLDGVTITFLKDKNIEIVEFKSGKLDMISGLSESQKDQLLELNGTLKNDLLADFYLVKKPWLYTEYLGVLMENTKAKLNPLQQKKIRQAIAYAIDMKTYISHFRNGIGQPAATGFVPMGMPNYGQYAIEGYNYDVDKAKKLLSEAGFPEGKGLSAITLSVTHSKKTICEYIVNSCADIGIKVDLVIEDQGSFNQKIAQFEANFYRKSWIADFPEAINYFQLFYGKNLYPEYGFNYTHFKNTQYDAIYEKALIENEDTIRYSYYKQLHQIIKDEAPVIPLFYGESLRFLSGNVSGIKVNSLNFLSLKTVRKKR